MAKRRSNGEGSISHRYNGKWQAQVSVEGKRLARTFESRDEARAWVSKIRKQIAKGLSLSKASMKIEKYLEIWIDLVSMTLRPKTLYQYRGIVANHLIPALGNNKLIDLLHAQVQQLVIDMHKRGIGVRTIQLAHAVLRRALFAAQQTGLVSENPAIGTQLPRKKRAEMMILEPNQIATLLNAATGSRIEAILKLALITGMRQGELLGLRWGDVDFASSTIRVRRQLQRLPKQGLAFTEPKTKNGIRTITLGRKSLQILMEQWNSLERELGQDQKASALVFPSTIGTPWEPRNLFRAFKRMLEKAGLPPIRFHDLRHTAASLMIASGRPIINISRQLGHSKASTTLDIYGHLVPGMEAEGAEMQDQLVLSTAAELQQAAIDNGLLVVNNQNVAAPTRETATFSARPEGLEPPTY